MKPILQKNNGKLNLVVKISDDRMKLFLDADQILEEITVPAPTGSAEQGAGAANSGAGSADQPESTAAVPAAPQKQKLPPKPVTRDELVKVLAEAARQEFLDLSVIDDIAAVLSRGESCRERRIAKGVEAQDGADGKLLLLVKKLSGTGEVHVNEKGIADLRRLHMFDNVEKGTLVARIYPPKNGTEGRDALGRPIPAKPGRPAKVTLDRTLQTRAADKAGENYQVLIADADGFLFEEGGRLEIKTELSVSGNLDYHFGVIDFIGSVKINGNVLPGFSVRARNGITVGGDVREAALICPQGDIVVRGYIYGGKDGRVLAGRNFEFHVAQELEAEVAGNIIIEKEATDCQFRCQGMVLSPEGTLAGGLTLSVCGVELKNFGTEKGKVTKVAMCSDVEMTTEYMELQLKIAQHEKAITLIDLHLGPLALNPARIELLVGAYRDKMRKLLGKKDQIVASLHKLREAKEAKLAGAHSNSTPRVNVHGAMYEGAEVQIGESKYKAQETTKGPITLDYSLDGKTFSIGDLKPLECTVPGPEAKS